MKSCSARAPLQNAQQMCACVERVTCAVSILESFQTALNKVNLSLPARCARAIFYILYKEIYVLCCYYYNLICCYICHFQVKVEKKTAHNVLDALRLMRALVYFSFSSSW